MKAINRFSMILAAGVALAACGGSTPPPTDPAGSATSGSTTPESGTTGSVPTDDTAPPPAPESPPGTSAPAPNLK